MFCRVAVAHANSVDADFAGTIDRDVQRDERRGRAAVGTTAVACGRHRRAEPVAAADLTISALVHCRARDRAVECLGVVAAGKHDGEDGERSQSSLRYLALRFVGPDGVKSHVSSSLSLHGPSVHLSKRQSGCTYASECSGTATKMSKRQSPFCGGAESQIPTPVTDTPPWPSSLMCSVFCGGASGGASGGTSISASTTEAASRSGCTPPSDGREAQRPAISGAAQKRSLPQTCPAAQSPSAAQLTVQSR